MENTGKWKTEAGNGKQGEIKDGNGAGSRKREKRATGNGNHKNGKKGRTVKKKNEAEKPKKQKRHCTQVDGSLLKYLPDNDDGFAQHNAVIAIYVPPEYILRCHTAV